MASHMAKTCSTAKNLAIVSVEFPALEIHEHFSVDLSDSARQQQTILTSVVEALHDVVGGGGNALAESFDMNSSKDKLDYLRSEGLHALEEWRKKLRAADEGLARADSAKASMNSMRDAYFKELQHLREQLYRKENAKKAGIEFQPDEVIAFDATEYCFDPEYINIVNEKFQRMERSWAEKYKEQQLLADEKAHMSADQLRTYADQAESARLLAEHNEQLLEQVREHHGYSTIAEMLQASGKRGDQKHDGLMRKASQKIGRAKESALHRFRVKSSLPTGNEALAPSSSGTVSSGDTSPKKKPLLSNSSFVRKIFPAKPEPLCFDAPVPDQPSELDNKRQGPSGRTIQFKTLIGCSSSSSTSLSSTGSPYARPLFSAPCAQHDSCRQDPFRQIADSLRSAFGRPGRSAAIHVAGGGQNNASYRSDSLDSGAGHNDANEVPPAGFNVDSAIVPSKKRYQHAQIQSELGGWMVEEALRFWHERQSLMKGRCHIGLQAQPSCESVGIQCAVSLPETELLVPLMDQSQQEFKKNTTDNFNNDAFSRHANRCASTPTKLASDIARRQCPVKGSASKIGRSLSVRGGAKDLQAVEPSVSMTSSLGVAADDLRKSVAVLAIPQNDEDDAAPAAKTRMSSKMILGEKLAISSPVVGNLLKIEGPRCSQTGEDDATPAAKPRTSSKMMLAPLGDKPTMSSAVAGNLLKIEGQRSLGKKTQ